MVAMVTSISSFKFIVVNHLVVMPGGCLANDALVAMILN